MVAGPIERYNTLGNSLGRITSRCTVIFSEGFRLVLFGLLVKMAMPIISHPMVNQVYENPMQYSSVEVLMAVFLFSFQIYADFFCYSTIASEAPACWALP